MKVVAILAAILVTLTHGHQFEVEWTITGDPIELCIPPGEHVDFLWEGGHNIVKVNKEVYEKCSDLGEKFDINDKPINRTAGAGDYKFTAPDDEGTHYFICGVGGHCAFGNQKAKIS